MTWNSQHEAKTQAIDTALRAVTVAKKLADYPAVEALLHAARAIALSRSHSITGLKGDPECDGGAANPLCRFCQAVHFIEGALNTINPDPMWKPRLDPDTPRIMIPGGV